jgi:DNA-binding NarL/FixJ family response regulator
VVTYAFAALLVGILTQVAALALLWRRRRDVLTIKSRIKQLAEALALLTDTTQSGLATVADELERGRRPRSGASSRTAATRRIAQAVGRGRAVRDIAADEQVSESEIRLHLGLATDRMASPRNDALHVSGSEKRLWLAPNTSR